MIKRIIGLLLLPCGMTLLALGFAGFPLLIVGMEASNIDLYLLADILPLLYLLFCIASAVYVMYQGVKLIKSPVYSKELTKVPEQNTASSYRVSLSEKEFLLLMKYRFNHIPKKKSRSFKAIAIAYLVLILFGTGMFLETSIDFNPEPINFLWLIPVLPVIIVSFLSKSDDEKYAQTELSNALKNPPAD